jgi:hypothetical protein
VEIKTPTGEVLDVEDPALLRMLSQGLRDGHVQTLLRSERAMTDCRPVSLHSLQTARQLGDETGVPLDKRRFRARSGGPSRSPGPGSRTSAISAPTTTTSPGGRSRTAATPTRTRSISSGWSRRGRSALSVSSEYSSFEPKPHLEPEEDRCSRVHARGRRQRGADRVPLAAALEHELALELERHSVLVDVRPSARALRPARRGAADR